MRTNRLTSSLIISLTAAAGALALGVAAVSCGGGDNQPLPSTDASADHTTDAQADTSTDVMSDDVATDSPGNDAPGEAAGDDGGGEAGCNIAVPTSLGDFITALAETACKRLQTCCQVQPSQFDMANCISILSDPSYGGWLGTASAVPYFDGGTITYDPSAACQCLEGTAAIACGNVPSAQWSSLTNTCLNAEHGTVPLDGGCSSSYQCAPSSSYCQLGPDGGTCAPLVPDGGTCQTDDDCSYLANGAPLLYCDTGSHSCVPRLINGTACQDNAMCASNICLYTVLSEQCVGSAAFSDPGTDGGTCDTFTIKDAGGDG